MQTAQEKFDVAERLRTTNQAATAIPYYMDVATDAKTGDDLKLEALHMLGVSYRMNRQLAFAQKQLEHALQLAQEIQAPLNKVAAIRIDIGETLRQQHLLDSAQTTIRAALSQLDPYLYPVQVGIGMGFLGRIDADRRDYATACSRYRRASTLLARDSDNRPWLYNLLPWAEAASRNGDFLTSRQLAWTALTVSLRQHNRKRALWAAAVFAGGWRLSALVKRIQKK